MTSKCWEGNDLNIRDITVSLSEQSINILQNFVENNYTLFNEINFGEEEFRNKALSLDIIKSEIKDLMSNYLNNGSGILLINKILPKSYTDINNMKSEDIFINGKDICSWKGHKNKIKTALAVISHHLGHLQFQGEEDDDEGERLVIVKEIKDRGMSYGQCSRAHYSDTNQGGDYHTDGAERPFPIPKYLSLLCIRQASSGGETIIKSIYPAHNRLLKNKPKQLQRLYENFFWDRRGSQNKNEPGTFEKPIFFQSSNESLIFSYLRKYIESGHSIRKISLKTKDISALDALDKEISDEDSYLSIKLKPGNLFISNNYFTIHGRPKSGFTDSKHNHLKKRLMIRTWVSDN
jgi:hypothetical protein